MSQADKSVPGLRQSSTAVLVVGGGIMGLWAALKAAEAGLSVILCERGRIGQGASGGLLGALFPWLPERWEPKKQFQFDALMSLPDEIAALERETGLSAHFSRSGRLIPLPKPHLRPLAEAFVADSRANWQKVENGPSWQVLDKSPVPDWLPDESGPHGFSLDGMAARVSPRDLTGLLHAALKRRQNVTIIEGEALTALDPGQGVATIGGQTLAFGHAVIAAGVESFPMLERLLPVAEKPLGERVKGQAALLAADVDPSLPVIFLNGLYIVAHEGGHVAIGSTSESQFDAPFSTDRQLERLVSAARSLAPALENAPVIERWAGLRPKAIGSDPLIGPLPDHDNIIAMTGGFKISFGIAHRLATCVTSMITGQPGPDLPESFRMAAHLARR
jgi:glycine oxidase